MLEWRPNDYCSFKVKIMRWKGGNKITSFSTINSSMHRGSNTSFHFKYVVVGLTDSVTTFLTVLCLTYAKLIERSRLIEINI